MTEPAADPSPSDAGIARADLHARDRRRCCDGPARAGRRRRGRGRVRDALVELHLPLAEYLARRFGNRGEPHEDLVQVATIGLIKAIDRFDLERGVAFSTYATPTIVGEIKRHFRDRGWAIRVPRRLQEIQAGHQPARRRPRPGAGPLPHGRRARRARRDERGGDPRGAGVGQRLQPAVARRPRPERRGSARWSSSSATTTTRWTPSRTARRSSRCWTCSTRGPSGSCCCGSSAT